MAAVEIRRVTKRFGSVGVIHSRDPNSQVTRVALGEDTKPEIPRRGRCVQGSRVRPKPDLEHLSIFDEGTGMRHVA